MKEKIDYRSGKYIITPSEIERPAPGKRCLYYFGECTMIGRCKYKPDGTRECTLNIQDESTNILQDE